MLGMHPQPRPDGKANGAKQERLSFKQISKRRLRTCESFFSRKYLVKLADHIPRIVGAFAEPVFIWSAAFDTASEAAVRAW